MTLQPILSDIAGLELMLRTAACHSSPCILNSVVRRHFTAYPRRSQLLEAALPWCNADRCAALSNFTAMVSLTRITMDLFPPERRSSAGRREHNMIPTRPPWSASGRDLERSGAPVSASMISKSFIVDSVKIRCVLGVCGSIVLTKQ